MELRHLQYFVAVAEARSFTRAAANLRLTQPSLSRQLRALEHELGGPLFRRSQAGAELTPAGATLLPHAQRLLAAAATARAEVAAVAAGRKGSLRIGYLMSTVGGLVAPALRRFRAAHPDIQVSLEEMTPAEQARALEDNRIDLAVIGQAPGGVARSFYVRPLARHPLCAVLPAGHPRAREPRLALADLREETFLTFPDDEVPGRNDWLRQLARAAGFRPRLGRRADSHTALLALIASGEGIALLPASLQALPSAGAVFVPLSDEGAQVPCELAWRQQSTSPVLRAMIDALVATAREDDGGVRS